MDEEKRKRSKNFTPIEASAFLELMTSARVRLIEDKSTHGPIVRKKSDCWEKVCNEFNALGFGVRTVAQLKEYWKRKKKELKKLLAEKKREVRGTGGGPSEISFPPFLQKMSDLIPRVYLDAPSELQNSYDSDRGLHAHVVTTAENSAEDFFQESFVAYLEQSDADKNFASEVAVCAAPLGCEIESQQHEDTSNLIADSSQSKTDEATSSEEITHTQGATSSKTLSVRSPAARKNAPLSGSLGRAGHRQPMNEFQKRLLQMAEEEYTARMEIFDLKRKYWKKMVSDSS